MDLCFFEIWFFEPKINRKSALIIDNETFLPIVSHLVRSSKISRWRRFLGWIRWWLDSWCTNGSRRIGSQRVSDQVHWITWVSSWNVLVCTDRFCLCCGNDSLHVCMCYVFRWYFFQRCINQLLCRISFWSFKVIPKCWNGFGVEGCFLLADHINFKFDFS